MSPQEHLEHAEAVRKAALARRREAAQVKREEERKVTVPVEARPMHGETKPRREPPKMEIEPTECDLRRYGCVKGTGHDLGYSTPLKRPVGPPAKRSAPVACLDGAGRELFRPVDTLTLHGERVDA